MTGVTTMGRGLVTLHARGETLENVPMSIQDLIGVASYHFRKSHLGVLQTVRSHPEVSERLLMNQISWNDMLMRLFKTRDKLAQKSEIGIRNSELGSEKAEAVGIDNACSDNSASLPSGEKQLLPGGAADEGFDPFKVFGSTDRGFSEPAAMSEPGAFSAPRAFKSFENQTKTRNEKECGNEKKCGIRNSEIGDRAEIGNQEVTESRDEAEKIGNVEMNSERQPADERQETAISGQPGAGERSTGNSKNELEKKTADEDRLIDSDPSLDPDFSAPPPYLDMLLKGLKRGANAGEAEGTLIFTGEERRALLDDPVFCRYEPELAENLRGYDTG